MAFVLLKCVILSDMLLHVDPAGAKPRRDHRFLACVSRHVVPKTAGDDDALYLDPLRVTGKGLSARRPARGRGVRGGSLYIGHRFADDRCLWSEHPSGASQMTDQRLDLDPLRIAPDAHSSVCDPQEGCPMRIWAMLWSAGQTGRVGCPRHKSLF